MNSKPFPSTTLILSPIIHPILLRIPSRAAQKLWISIYGCLLIERSVLSWSESSLGSVCGKWSSQVRNSGACRERSIHAGDLDRTGWPQIWRCQAVGIELEGDNEHHLDVLVIPVKLKTNTPVPFHFKLGAVSHLATE
jgi:hypothetical protein